MEEQEIVKIIEDKYKIDIEKIEKSKESTDGNVYIIKDKNKKYALKLYESEEHTNAMVKIHSLLADNKIDAPQIIKSAQNNNYEVYKKIYLVLYSFVEGKKIKEIEFDNNKIKQVSEYLKKLHSIKIKDDDEFKAVALPGDNAENVLLHFDVTKNNIFAADNKIVFIDFDDAKYGPATFDIAIAVTNLFISKSSGANIEEINLFINEYYDNDTKKINEQLPKIKEAALYWLNETVSKQNLSSSIKEGLNNKINWINRIWS